MLMNLGKLLGTGKSFFGGKQTVAYRMNRIMLPKFNDGKNPFTPKSAPEEPAAPKAEIKTAPAKPVAPKFAAPVAAVKKTPAPVVAEKPRQNWATRLNPFRPPTPAPRPLAVQSELSLDAVKVMHNDLSDADVDIVPVKSHASAAAAPVLPPARRAWEYLGESVVNS
jgi:hypothetical protein